MQFMHKYPWNIDAFVEKCYNLPKVRRKNQKKGENVYEEISRRTASDDSSDFYVMFCVSGHRVGGR